MTTVGNAHTTTTDKESVGNHHVRQNAEKESVDDPTTDGNGDVTVGLRTLRVLDDTEDVSGVDVTGPYRAEVEGVTGNTVTVRITEPDGAGGFAAVAGTTLNGETLTVEAHD